MNVGFLYILTQMRLFRNGGFHFARLLSSVFCCYVMRWLIKRGNNIRKLFGWVARLIADSVSMSSVLAFKFLTLLLYVSNFKLNRFPKWKRWFVLLLTVLTHHNFFRSSSQSGALWSFWAKKISIFFFKFKPFNFSPLQRLHLTHPRS